MNGWRDRGWMDGWMDWEIDGWIPSNLFWIKVKWQHVNPAVLNSTIWSEFGRNKALELNVYVDLGIVLHFEKKKKPQQLQCRWPDYIPDMFHKFSGIAFGSGVKFLIFPSVCFLYSCRAKSLSVCSVFQHSSIKRHCMALQLWRKQTNGNLKLGILAVFLNWAASSPYNRLITKWIIN